MIGRTVTFIRTIDREGQRQAKNIEHTGLVLDKIRGHEKIDGKIYPADYYLVELENGMIGKFFCDEAKRFVLLENHYPPSEKTCGVPKSNNPPAPPQIDSGNRDHHTGTQEHRNTGTQEQITRLIQRPYY